MRTWYLNECNLIKTDLLCFLSEKEALSLLTPPFIVFHDMMTDRLYVKSAYKPKDSLIYGVYWKELGSFPREME